MKTSIRSRGFALTQSLSDYVTRRLYYGLSHLGQSIRRVNVLLSDINGPNRGGIDKRCQIIVYHHGQPATVVMDTESDLYLAIDRAAGRVSRRLARMQSRQSMHGQY